MDDSKPLYDPPDSPPRLCVSASNTQSLSSLSPQFVRRPVLIAQPPIRRGVIREAFRPRVPLEQTPCLERYVADQRGARRKVTCQNVRVALAARLDAVEEI